MILLYFASFASITGLLGLIMLFWQYVLGVRVVAKFFTNDFVWLNKVHQNIGIWGMLFVFAHPLMALISYGAYWFQLVLPEVWTPYDIYIMYGKIAISIVAVIWITSALFRRNISYRWWKRIHFISYLVFPLVYMHSLNVGTTLLSTNLRYFWYLLGAIYPIIVAVSILHHLGFFKRKGTIIKKEHLNTEVNRFTIELERPINVFPGQFIYIQLSRGGESHPFTVSHIVSGTQIMISPKKEGKFTKMLDTIVTPKKVFVDGPYGVFTAPAFEVDAPIVFLAGGIGITPFIETSKRVAQDKVLFYSEQTYTNAPFREELLRIYEAKSSQQKGTKDADIVFAITKEKCDEKHCEEGRIDEKMLRKYLKKSLGGYQYYICGPKGFIKAMKQLLKSQGVRRQQIQTEEFSL